MHALELIEKLHEMMRTHDDLQVAGRIGRFGIMFNATEVSVVKIDKGFTVICIECEPSERLRPENILGDDI